jgi:hypothetical protein
MDIDNDELLEPIDDDEVSPERWSEMKAERKLTSVLPDLEKMYKALADMREAYRAIRIMAINEKHIEFIDTLDMLDWVIKEWVVEIHDVEDRKGITHEQNTSTP